MCILQDGSRVPFKVKKTTVFDKLFRAYCQKKALDQSTLIFMDAEGKRVLPHQTPAEVSTRISLEWPMPVGAMCCLCIGMTVLCMVHHQSCWSTCAV